MEAEGAAQMTTTAGSEEPEGPRGGLREGDVLGHSLGDVVGRPWTRIGLWILVAVAAAVDIVTFYQVLLGLYNLPPRAVAVYAVGFAAIALPLAHWTGLQARQAVSRREDVRSRTVAAITGTVWLALGIFALIVRLNAPQVAADAVPKLTPLDGSTSPASPAQDAAASANAYNAWFFFVLYTATGTVAAVTGFTRPDPSARRLVTAQRRKTRLQKKNSRTAGTLTRIEESLEAIAEARTRRTGVLAASQQQSSAAVEKLKHEAWIYLRTQTQRRPPAAFRWIPGGMRRGDRVPGPRHPAPEGPAMAPTTATVPDPVADPHPHPHPHPGPAEGAATRFGHSGAWNPGTPLLPPDDRPDSDHQEKAS